MQTTLPCTENESRRPTSFIPNNSSPNSGMTETIEPTPESPADETDPEAPVARRRHIDPTTCERDYSVDEVEFMTALDAYKRSSGRQFPTCSEMLEVLRSLGYVKIAPQS